MRKLPNSSKPDDGDFRTFIQALEKCADPASILSLLQLWYFHKHLNHVTMFVRVPSFIGYRHGGFLFSPGSLTKRLFLLRLCQHQDHLTTFLFALCREKIPNTCDAFKHAYRVCVLSYKHSKQKP